MHSRKGVPDPALSVGAGVRVTAHEEKAVASSLKSSPPSVTATRFFGGGISRSRPSVRHSSADSVGIARPLGGSTSLPLLARTTPPQGSHGLVSSLPSSRSAGFSARGIAGRSDASSEAAEAPSTGGLLHIPVQGDTRLRACALEVFRIDTNLTDALGAAGSAQRSNLGTPSALEAAHACARALNDLASAPATLALVPDPVTVLLMRVAAGLDVALQGLASQRASAPLQASLAVPMDQSSIVPATVSPHLHQQQQQPPRLLTPILQSSVVASGASQTGPPGQATDLDHQRNNSAGLQRCGAEAAAMPDNDVATGASLAPLDAGALEEDDDDDDGFGPLDDCGSSSGIQIVRVPSESQTAAAAAVAANSETISSAPAIIPVVVSSDAATTKPASSDAAHITVEAAETAASGSADARPLPSLRLLNPAQLIMQRHSGGARGSLPASPVQAEAGSGGGIPRLGLGLMKQQAAAGGADYHEEFMAGAEDWSLSWREEAGMHPRAAMDAALAAGSRLQQHEPTEKVDTGNV